MLSYLLLAIIVLLSLALVVVLHNSCNKNPQEYESLLYLVEQKFDKIEQSKEHFTQILQMQLQHLNSNQAELKQQTWDLKAETQKLSQALRSSNTVGKWGEVQLHKLLELSGMLAYSEFETQPRFSNNLRPDAIIKLPNKRIIIIDAKTPMQSYLKMLDCVDDKQQQLYLLEHVKALKGHILSLSRKEYHSLADINNQRTLMFTVLFLPNESLWHSALLANPELLDYATQYNIFIATPTTLITMLKTIHYCWQQQNLIDNLEEISLSYKEINNFYKQALGSMQLLGKNIQETSRLYNAALKLLNNESLEAIQSKIQQFALKDSQQRLENESGSNKENKEANKDSSSVV